MRTLSIVLLLASTVVANAQPATHGKTCFFVTQFEDWRAPDDRTIIIRTDVSNYFRLGLSQACPELKMPQAHLIMNVRGPSTICSPVDWDLKVSGGTRDIPMPCIVSSMETMSPAQVDALPKKFKP